MRIIIAGMGDVGYQLARELSYEAHDIIAIDQNHPKKPAIKITLTIVIIFIAQVGSSSESVSGIIIS